MHEGLIAFLIRYIGAVEPADTLLTVTIFSGEQIDQVVVGLDSLAVQLTDVVGGNLA